MASDYCCELLSKEEKLSTVQFEAVKGYFDDDQFFVFINECYGSVFSVYRKVQYPENIKSCDADVCGRRADRFS